MKNIRVFFFLFVFFIWMFSGFGDEIFYINNRRFFIMFNLKHWVQFDITCRFILNDNILFWSTISYHKLFVFSVYLFCSHIYSKIKFTTKILTSVISIVKWFFCFFTFTFFMMNLNQWCFTTILWKFQKKWTSVTCWKHASKLPTYSAFIFNMEKKKWKYLMF